MKIGVYPTSDSIFLKGNALDGPETPPAWRRWVWKGPSALFREEEVARSEVGLALSEKGVGIWLPRRRK